MTYNIQNLARLSGVSSRTLRYYDEIGLLSPKRSDNGYRLYDEKDVDLLQQILFYRELEVPLEEIREILLSKSYDKTAALSLHLAQLRQKRANIERLIENVEKTIAASKGEITMNDKEKFEGFKKSRIDENEKKYGIEIREQYGDEVIDASNAKLMGMTRQEYSRAEELSAQINESLRAAFSEGDPAGETARETCRLHQEWIKSHWADYSKEAHMALAEGYVADPRFKAYYDKIADGCAVFLRDALKLYLG